MQTISAKDLKNVFECAINDRFGFADAYRRADKDIYEKSMQEVKKFRQMSVSLFGDDTTWIERGAASFANGKKSMSVKKIKSLLDSSQKSS